MAPLTISTTRKTVLRYAGFFIIASICASLALASAICRGQTSTAGSSAAALNVFRYLNLGYTVEGPVPVQSATATALELFKADRTTTIDLQGKQVTVLDENSNRISVTGIKKGARVYVCQKGTTVDIYVLPKKERGPDAPKH